MNDTFLRACRGEAVEYTPVWIMRQAGRYLPEYHQVRRKGTFLDLCKTPHNAAEVSIQPVDIVGVDAAILFSDILVPLEPMGMELDFVEGRGPVLANPIRCREDVNRLRIPDADNDLSYVMETIRILRRELAAKVPLIGFSGAPFTLATYMIEGGSSRNFWNTKKMMYQAPEVYDALLTKITDCTIAYLASQAAAGAQALQIFDSWAGALAPCDFERFAIPHVRRIVTTLRQKTDVPLIYFANNGSSLLEISKTSGADVLGLDWRINLDVAVHRLGTDVSLQGNMDPIALLLPEEKLAARVASILAQAKGARGHIFNLGHGILPETPPEQAKLLVQLVHEQSAR